MEKGKTSFANWISKHKKELVIVSLITITAAPIVVFAVVSAKSGPNKYSTEWIRSLSPEEWSIQRETVRKQYCTAGNTPEGGRLQQLLWLFDSVKREKEPPLKGPFYPYNREHGWNLYKPD